MILIVFLLIVSSFSNALMLDSTKIHNCQIYECVKIGEKRLEAEECIEDTGLFDFDSFRGTIVPRGKSWTQIHQSTFIEKIDCIEYYLQDNAVEILSSFHTEIANRKIDFLYKKFAQDYPFLYTLEIINALENDKAFIPTLRKMLDDSIPNIRGEAALALAQLGDANSSVRIRELLKDTTRYFGIAQINGFNWYRNIKKAEGMDRTSVAHSAKRALAILAESGH